MEIAEIATQHKRPRQDCELGSSPNPSDNFLEDGPHHEDSVKRHKPYSTILSLLDDDDDDDGEYEPSDQDLSAMFTTLQRELMAACPSPDDHNHPPSLSSNIGISDDDDDLSQLYYIDLGTEKYDGSSVATSADEDDEKVRSLMRDLLEASDDELGIPNYINNNGDENNYISTYRDNKDQCSEEMVPFGFSGDKGFWEIDDEAANSYTVLQSQLFM